MQINNILNSLFSVIIVLFVIWNSEEPMFGHKLLKFIILCSLEKYENNQKYHGNVLVNFDRFIQATFSD